MYRYPASSFKSILIDVIRASLKRSGVLLNCLVVFSFMVSPFTALPVRAAESVSPEASIDQDVPPSDPESELAVESTLPATELVETATVTNTEGIQELATPYPDLFALPEESAEYLLPSVDPSLDITPTLPVIETDVEIDPVLAPYPEEITHTMQVEKPSLIEAGGGQAIGLGGQISLKVPQGAVQKDLEVFIRPAVSLPLTARSPSGEPFEIVAYRQDTREEVTQFDRPLTIELAYDESRLRGDESTLMMVYYDEQKDSWEPLPTFVDEENNVVSAETDHLTVFDTTYADWEGSMLPSLKDFQVAPFTGASTYSLPIWTPPGPGGLKPNLELRYNSQTIDNSIAERTQASWVGMGWSLDTGYIERNMKGTPYDWDDDTFSISVGGVDSLLLKGGDGYYHTADESFWRIEKVSATDSWIARDKTGNTYIFGDNDNTRSMYKTDFVCIYDPDPHCTVYTGAWRWSLHIIRNAFGKELTFNYHEDTQAKRVHAGGVDYPYWADM